jgi:ABC-2 type transport system permease protein
MNGSSAYRPGSWSFLVLLMLARAYPRVAGLRRTPGWVLVETVLPVLSVSAFAFVYRAMHAPEEYLGFVILGGAMTAFWLNVIWSMGAQFYWDREAGNLELFLASPCSLMAVLAGMALGGMALTSVRAAAIVILGGLLFGVPFTPTSWWALITTFLLLMLALYGLGMVFASVFLHWGRQALHVISLLQEPVYVFSGLHFPVKVLGTALSSAAALLPLTAGVDALRQILFPRVAGQGLLPVWIEILILAVLSVSFITLARFLLAYMERVARREGRLTVRWL